MPGVSGERKGLFSCRGEEKFETFLQELEASQSAEVGGRADAPKVSSFLRRREEKPNFFLVFLRAPFIRAPVTYTLLPGK